MKTHNCQTEEDTKTLARTMAPDLSGVVALNGTLGAGKSTFARAVIQTLTGTQDDIPSPTFTLVQEYQTDIKNIYHLDLYRLEDADEIFELGWEDMVNDTDLILIEWSERITEYLPQNKTNITINIMDQNSREVVIS